MKKAILISIRPEWVEKILNGKKTIEIRKAEPKCDLPIDVYIYCTHGYSLTHLANDATRFCVHQFKDDDKKMKCVGTSELDGPLNGKVVAKFTLDGKFFCGFSGYGKSLQDVFLKEACLTRDEMEEYADGKEVFMWGISDLEVFDEPKELSDFFSLPKTYHHDYESMVDYYERKEAMRLKRAPQSWQYVEVD